MKAGDESFEKLRAALDEVAISDAEEVLREARTEARVRVRSMLSDALAHAMLEHAHHRLRAPQRTREPERRTEPESRTEGEQASYLYGVIDADDCEAIQGIEGITVVREGDLAAAAGRVPLEDFEEHTLREHLADMAWVERTARAHERTLEAIRSRTTVVPMRMCSVYRTESGVRDMLRRESESLRGALSRLKGKTEWGVKVMLDPSQQKDDRSSPAAYMQRRREQLDQDQDLTARVQEATSQTHESLSAVASEGVLVPLQRPEASGRRIEMVLNGAYLVEDVAQNRFREQVSALQDRFAPLGLVLELTGPWPAYNFVGGTIGATL
jgi:hypothetical protein